MAGTTNDVTYGLDAYNPASQVTQRSTSNDSYVWTNAVNVNRAYTVNGLNQYESAGPAVFGYDGNGNLTSDGTNGFVYDVENRLVSRTGATTASLRYDPLGRLYEVAGSSGTTRFLHDGDTRVRHLWTKILTKQRTMPHYARRRVPAGQLARPNGLKV